MTRLAPLAVIAAALLLPAGCECRSREQQVPAPIVIVAEPPDDLSGFPASPSATIHDAGHDARLHTSDDLPMLALHELNEDERRITWKIIRLLQRYYPTWDEQDETADEHYQRWYDSPEIARFMETIDRRTENDRVWPVFFDDVTRKLGRGVSVQSGAPPGFYVPSFILVAYTEKGRATAVYRLSMLLPLYDYYEVIREPGRLAQIHLTPRHEDTRRIASVVRPLIAELFPGYRELPPRLGSVLVRTMRADNSLLGETSLAQLLFCDVRNW